MTEELICCICYKPIPAKGTWTHGDNAEPLTVAEWGHSSLVKHTRCCGACNDLVVQVRIMQAFGQHEISDAIIGLFKDAKHQGDVILAHMKMLMAFTASMEKQVQAMEESE